MEQNPKIEKTEEQKIEQEQEEQNQQQQNNTKSENNIDNKFEFDLEYIKNHTYFNKETDTINNMHHRISIAPMLDVTNPYWRFLYRLVSRKSTLYTEMIHANALIHTNPERTERIDMNLMEKPVVFQLGGCDPNLISEAGKVVEKLGYDEINLNCGCPSGRVQSGSFGACLMKSPTLVANCMKQLRENVSIPCSVKHRLGVDEFDDYDFMKKFVKEISETSGVTHFQAHARKALLKGLNPAQNRNIPPLMYERVIQLKKDFPHLDISINGGFKSYQQVQDILKPEYNLTGCMIGRWAQENIWNLNDVDRQFYNCPNPGYSRREILLIYAEYADQMLKKHNKLSVTKLLQPLIPLFSGESGNTAYRRFMSIGKEDFATNYTDFKSFINKSIQLYERINKKSLDERPPRNDEEAELARQKVERQQQQIISSNEGQKKKEVEKKQIIDVLDQNKLDQEKQEDILKKKMADFKPSLQQQRIEKKMEKSRKKLARKEEAKQQQKTSVQNEVNDQVIQEQKEEQKKQNQNQIEQEGNEEEEKNMSKSQEKIVDLEEKNNNSTSQQQQNQ